MSEGDTRANMHVDMDAFYATVEQRDDPSLKGKPVIVGGQSRRGVVSAASYEVRRFGVRSAMPMVEAMRRCPHAVVISPRMNRYVEVSEQVFDVFHRYTPLVEGLSIDEAFLDVTGSRTLFGSAVSIAKTIKADIFQATGLRASAGVAPSKFVAKVASDLDKPDGLVVVAPEGVEAFLAPLPIERMWGVGPKAAARLHGLGFETFSDLAEVNADVLAAAVGKWGRRIHALARGDDHREVVPDRDAKSIGAEMTFGRDLKSVEDLQREILAQCVRVGARLHRNGLWAGTVTLKIKYGDHSVRTRQRRCDPPIGDTDRLFDAARELLTRFDDLHRGVRLTGVSASGLTVDAGAGLFPDESRERSESIEAVTRELRERFGPKNAVRARLLDRDEADRPGYDMPKRGE
ncbi:MAG: DNA polymerase IV [Myxococcota bacterium]